MIAVDAPAATHPQHRHTHTAASSLGWLPGLSLSMSVGLVVVALADTLARRALPPAEPAFWLGLLIIFAPVALRLVFAAPNRAERVALVTLLGMSLYITKILYSPLGFTGHDEFLHWRTLDDILLQGRLFTPNPLLPVSARYPGAETATAALVNVSGIDLFLAGLVVVGAARLVLVLALFGLYEHLTRSPRIAGIGTLLYMANPNFLYFDAAFSYESVALPMAVFATYLIARYVSAPTIRTLLMLLPVLVMVVTTHHITSFIFTGLLALWIAVALVRRVPSPLFIGLAVVAAELAWLLTLGDVVVGYLGPHLTAAVNELVHMLVRTSASQSAAEPPRQLFVSTTGTVAPVWERITSLGAVGLILLGLPGGLWIVWRRMRAQPLAIVLAISVAAYPVSLAFRLTGAGWESANRSSEFLFIGIAFVIALVICGVLSRARHRWQVRAGAVVVSAYASILLMGGFISGWPPAWRMPGPYAPDTGERSIEPQGIAAAIWAHDVLGPDHHVGADATNMLLMGSYGHQDVETSLSGGIDVDWILFAPHLWPDLQQSIASGHMRYLVVDHRLVDAPYLARKYYADASVSEGLDKFDNLPGVGRIFDSGDIRLYDLGSLAND